MRCQPFGHEHSDLFFERYFFTDVFISNHLANFSNEENVFWRCDVFVFVSYCGHCVYLFRVSLARRFVMSCSNKPGLFEKDDGLIVKCHPGLLLQMSSATACVAPP